MWSKVYYLERWNDGRNQTSNHRPSDLKSSVLSPTLTYHHDFITCLKQRLKSTKQDSMILIHEGSSYLYDSAFKQAP